MNQPTSRVVLTQAFCLANICIFCALLYGHLKWPGILFATTTASRYPTVTIAEAAQHLIKQDAQFVDARAFETYKHGHIAGALNVRLGEGIDVDSLEKVLAAKKVIVYCEGIDCHASDQAADELAEHGVKNIYLMPDGWLGWVGAGMPVMKVGKAIH